MTRHSGFVTKDLPLAERLAPVILVITTPWCSFTQNQIFSVNVTFWLIDKNLYHNLHPQNAFIRAKMQQNHFRPGFHL